MDGGSRIARWVDEVLLFTHSDDNTVSEQGAFPGSVDGTDGWIEGGGRVFGVSIVELGS